MSKIVAADKLQATLPTVLAEMAVSNEEVFVTSGGRAVARLVPITPRRSFQELGQDVIIADRPVVDHVPEDMRGPMYGTAQIIGDILAPIDDDWRCHHDEPEPEQYPQK